MVRSQRWHWATLVAVVGLSFATSCKRHLPVVEDEDAGRSDAGQKPPPSDARAPRGCAATLDDTTAVGFYEAVHCIFEGDAAIQTGVTQGLITPERVAVLRGRVLDRAGAPLAGVRVRVLSEEGYGQTLTDADGRYDLAVNGGAKTTLVFEKTGRLRVQRHREVPRRDFVPVDDVVMLARNPMMGKVSLDGMREPTVLSGPMETDASGARQHALMVRPGTHAMAMMPDGAGVSMSELSLHVTEFTVGARGAEAMPGDLPANSAYTYAAELAAEETEAMGAAELRFDPPLVNYVDNFLKFPAGTAVPVGYYNKGKDEWEAADSGVVIEIVDIDSGKAVIDADGDGKGDSSEALGKLGIDEAEQKLLGQRYTKGKSLWRALAPHFSVVDYNWGSTLPQDGVVAPAKGTTGGPEDVRCEASGSIIGCEDQTLGEVIPISGTGFALHYQSERMPGRVDRNEVEIVVSEAKVPASLRGIELEVSVLGQVTRKHFEPAANLRHVYRWDGRDAYGRTWARHAAESRGHADELNVRCERTARRAHAAGAKQARVQVSAGPSARELRAADGRRCGRGRWDEPV